MIVGSASNAMAIVVNGGWMPVWEPALDVGRTGPEELNAAFHRLLPADFGPEFFLRAGPIADIIPLPIPLLTNVSSIGDVFIAAGLGWFVFSTLVRGKEDPDGGISLGPGKQTVADSGIGRNGRSSWAAVEARALLLPARERWARAPVVTRRWWPTPSPPRRPIRTCPPTG